MRPRAEHGVYEFLSYFAPTDITPWKKGACTTQILPDMSCRQWLSFIKPYA